MLKIDWPNMCVKRETGAIIVYSIVPSQRSMAIISAMFMNTEFIYGERFAFTDRYVSSDSYFGSDPKLAALPYGEIVYQNNFIPDFKHVKVDHPPEGASRGEGFARRYLRLGGNRMLTFAAEYCGSEYEFCPRGCTSAHCNP